MNRIRNEVPESRIVVFIDDLDKCSPKTVLEVFESAKVFLGIKGFVYVLGLSYETISKLVSAKYETSGIRGEEYIREVIQIPITIPEWNQIDVIELIRNLSTKLDEKYSAIVLDNQHLIAEAVELNPREVKRFINSFILSYEIYSSTNVFINPKELLVVQALKSRWTDFYRYFSSYDSFRREVKEYIGLPENERIKKFTKQQKELPREYERILQNYISDPALWDLWNFLSKERDTIFATKDWDMYRRASYTIKEAFSAQNTSLEKNDRDWYRQGYDLYKLGKYEEAIVHG